MRLILLLRFEVTQQDIGSIPHLTMRQEEKKKGKIKKKKERKQAVRRWREKSYKICLCSIKWTQMLIIAYSIFNYRSSKPSERLTFKL